MFEDKTTPVQQQCNITGTACNINASFKTWVLKNSEKKVTDDTVSVYAVSLEWHGRIKTQMKALAKDASICHH